MTETLFKTVPGRTAGNGSASLDQKLVAISSFQESSPINLRWAIQLHYDELVHSGVLFRFGRKLLIDPEQFWVWLRESGHQAALR